MSLPLEVSLEYHHTGLVVKSIPVSVDHFSQVFGADNISQVFRINSQAVDVAFVKNGPETFLELVQPWDEKSSTYNLLKKRFSYYHVGYKVEDIHQSIAFLESLNYKALEVFKSEAFDGSKCVFLFSPEAHLVELMEI